MDKRVERAIGMLEVAANLIGQYAPDGKAHYDGVNYDGLRVSDDCLDAAYNLGVYAEDNDNG
jgi:hypothetical protein